MKTFDEIWAGDLLGRRAEAEDLMGYLESVAARPAIREDGHAHVLAVDARYGEGKTFFLRRLAEHMAAAEHPVAFVDAWVDDLEDEPLVALAATLQKALEPYTTEHPTVREMVATFNRQAGRVSAIVAAGFAKRALGLVITQGAVEVLGGVLDHGGEVAKAANQDAAKGTGQAVIDDAAKGMPVVTTTGMEARIATFREGQEAVTQMKAGLRAVVESLAELDIKTPVTIVIDELDRCRPTYAIKLLEEVKHLFDVSGVAFVLGLHADQLVHSVAAAYGSGFEAKSYLRRFFSRRYGLAPARLDGLVEMLVRSLSIPAGRIAYPMVLRTDSYRPEQLPLATFIADVMDSYGLRARDAFAIMEGLQTALALTAPHPVQLAYLLPLLVWQFKQVPPLAKAERTPPWQLAFSKRGWGDEHDAVSFEQFLDEVDSALRLDRDAFMKAVNGEPNWGTKMVWDDWSAHQHSTSYAQMGRYGELLRVVKRFDGATPE